MMRIEDVWLLHFFLKIVTLNGDEVSLIVILLGRLQVVELHPELLVLLVEAFLRCC